MSEVAGARNYLNLDLRKRGPSLFLDLVSRISGTLSALATVAMMAIMLFEVVSRYFFNEPTFWVTEISSYLVAGSTFLALAYAQRQGEHIQVGFLIDSINVQNKELLLRIGVWMEMAFVSMTAWQFGTFLRSEFIHNSRDWGLLATPQWIPETPVFIGLVAFVLAILKDAMCMKPTVSAGRQWGAVIIVGAAAMALIALGHTPTLILNRQIDVGSLVILTAIALCAAQLHGVRIGLMVLTVLTCLGALMFSISGSPALITSLIIVLLIVTFLLLGVRIYAALGLVGLLGLYFLLPRPQLAMLAEHSWRSLNSFTYTAVPTFILMGVLLVRSGVSSRFFDALVKWLYKIPGGLAQATIGASGMFAALSGSSIATAATIGQVAGPEMIKRGYDRRLALGSIAGGGTLGILIPPSIPMIIYGATVGVPVTLLFVAGIIPGLMVMVSMMLMTAIWCIVSGKSQPDKQLSYSWAERWESLTAIIPFSALIISVIGSLYLGVATPTEAGAIGAVFAVILCATTRTLSPKMLYDCTLETAKVTGSILLIVVGAAMISWVVDYIRIPFSLVRMVTDSGLPPWALLTFVGILYIVLGMFIDPISMMLMTLSVTYPIVQLAGYDGIWFGVALMMMIEVGLITPPVGMILFVLSGQNPNVPLSEIIKGAFPFVMIILLNIILLAMFPEIATWLPSQVSLAQ
jgi:tripartite ATP-independent transporter DctM subunit